MRPYQLYSQPYANRTTSQDHHRRYYQYRKQNMFGPYLMLQTLGEGEFGKVKLGMHIETQQEVAIKLIRKESVDNSTRLSKVEREISVLRIVRHPYIVKLYDVLETEKYIGIILECASGGELFEYILARRYLKEQDACRLFAQLVSGVHYLHQKHIVHRDLKLENLLLDRNRNVIITDFGFANKFSSAKDDLMATSCGSPCYAAPELVVSEGLYVGSAVDIWSCGVILYAMLCGYLPFDDDPANPDGDNINLLYKHILTSSLVFPDYVSPMARDLLHKMLVPDPSKRCDIQTIMDHPWLQQYRPLFSKSIRELELQATTAAELTLKVVPSNSNSSNSTRKAIDQPAEMRTHVSVQLNQVVPMIKEENAPVTTPQPTRIYSTSISTSTPKSTTFTGHKRNNTLTISPTPSSNNSTNAVSPRSHHRFASTSIAREAGSILHAKFLSSISRNASERSVGIDENKPTGGPLPGTSMSASVIPSNAAQLHQSPILTPSQISQPIPKESQSNIIRGTRRKALSLLVTPVAESSEEDSGSEYRWIEDDAPKEPQEKDRQKTTGKKMIDWIKKNSPFDQLGRSLGHVAMRARPSSGSHWAPEEAKLRIYHGAVDQSALTSRSPNDVFTEVKQTLKSMGIDMKFEGDYKIKCTRRKRKSKNGRPFPPSTRLRQATKQYTSSSLNSNTTTSGKSGATIYGDASIDSGDEIRFSVELCKFKNLHGLYIVDIRRMRGNIWGYKYVYHQVLEALDLYRKGGYIPGPEHQQSPSSNPIVAIDTKKNASFNGLGSSAEIKA
ncbi:kinase-like domain-containing protein [Umbelopsis sp. PMI_123]|nr:kinase-like domain-containing protein [Umbelopsis sp. PMI_123]